jgi:phospholipid-binding lipoprotein MlaA
MYDTIFAEKPNPLSILCCTILLCLSGCASTPPVGNPQTAAIDPYENLNRNIFDFNSSVDDYVAAPIADAYLWITPTFVQKGIGNFFSNLKDINVMFNDLLQAKFSQSAADSGRFLLNSTIGLGGLFDVATDIGLVKHEEDFDQTLATWGVPQGPYLVLPLLGPTTGRGISGTVFDAALNPASYVSVPVRALELLHLRANAKTPLKVIKESALDPYVFTREAFIQRRNYLISDGKDEPSVDNWDDDNESKIQVDQVDNKLHLKDDKPKSSTAKPLKK